ncbi:hypothetical protein [Oxalobacter paraformigenes]|uniref:Uncharacterized protein n=1 Tax=Oxalobacter paraformigenes TaxID=556268 RepID=C3X5W7_9BURK|nr:hypothetical protein [Oxalobacter paraformigenes]EEO28603.1 hypothetical protein OFAG_01756 [Oxalobacter paraformigenes]
MKKIRFAMLMAALGVSGIASAQVYSIGTAVNPPNNVTVVNSSSLIVEEVPASKITAELTDRDCPAGTTLIFDINDMNRAKCVWSYEAQKRMNNY